MIRECYKEEFSARVNDLATLAKNQRILLQVNQLNDFVLESWEYLRYNTSQVIAGWSSLVARRAHNPKVVGSNPAPATK